MKKAFIYFCVFGLVCSCSKDELLPAGSPAGNDPLAVTFVGGSSRGEWADSPQASTRANETSWMKDDSIGIYMLPSGNYDLTSSVWKNREYKVTSSGTLSPNGSANTLYYPVNGDNVRFVAYYPYSGAVSNDATLHKVSFDFTGQSTQAKKEAKDFCFHRGTKDYSRSNHTGLDLLNFNHKFSKILMTVESGIGGPSSLDGLIVELTNMPETATVDLNKLALQQGENDSIVVDNTATTITPFVTLSGNNKKATVEAIVAPHSGTGSFASRVFTFKISNGGDVRTYALPDEVEFESGKLYHFSFILRKGTTVVDKMTNSYIVVPGNTLEFPVSRAYVYDTENKFFTNTLHTGGEYTGAFSAEVVWDDMGVILKTDSDAPIVTGEGRAAQVTLKTREKREGNAVLAIKKAESGEIVWSYHIWATSYNPDPDDDGSKTYTNPANGLVFMDRNLGANFAGFNYYHNGVVDLDKNFGTGLFYQWGRKDPFPSTGNPGTRQRGGGTVAVAETSVDTGTIPYSIRNPNVFLIAEKYPQDWYYGTTRNNTLWDDSGNKTIYDPCPYGWRIPRYSTLNANGSPWQGFTKDNGVWTDSRGYTWEFNDIIVTYPFTASRMYNSGKCFGIPFPINADYWSASSSGSNAMSLYIGESSVNPANNSYRAYGFAVRCVRE
jgi:hypothetical protein